MLEFYPNLNINFLHGSTGPPPHADDLSADGAVKRELGCECCVGCGRPIQDRYIVRVGEASYHERCMTCCACGMFLEYSCFMRDDKPYCKNDYDRLFGAKCFRCGDTPLPQEMVMRVQHHVFHMLCFTCVVCCQPLQKGELFVMRAGHLFCRQDFEKELVLQQVDDDLLIDETGRPRDGRRGPKRPRTILTSAQRRQFKASFEVSPKPCRKVREALAKETGLSVRVVQVWFQNQRAKMKKIQRKSKQDVSDKDKDKEERTTKQESSSGENGHYSGIDSLTSQPLNPNMPFSPDVYHGNSVDSFGSSEISIDGSNFDQIDEGTSDTMSQTNMDMHHSQGPHGNSHHDHGLPSTSVSFINPIDKLYLMQNSYFSSDN